MVKAAGMEDLDAVAHLAVLLWPEHTFDALKNEMQALIRSKHAVIALYVFQNSAVGFAQCQLRHDYVEGTSSSPVGYLEGIFVDASHHGRGIAKELMQYCEEWARGHGCMEFGSDCEIENTQSLQFHLKAGFTEANRIICFSKKL